MKKVKQKRMSDRWETSFTTPNVQYVFVARYAQHRAIVVSNQSGNYQLHAYDFEAGTSRQITNTRRGVLFGSISQNGEYIYYLKDAAGNEHGHFVRVPFLGGKAVDVTPNLPPYYSYSVCTNENENILCFMAALDGKNRLFIVSINEHGFETPRELYTTEASLSEPVCSPDGKYICVAETDGGTLKSTLLLFRLTGDVNSAPVCSPVFSAVSPLAFSRTTPTVVLAFAREKADWSRPILFNFENKQTVMVSNKLFRGDVWALQWDEERNTLLLCDSYEAKQALYLYNLNTQRLRRVGPKSGSFNFHLDSAAFIKDNSIVLTWHDFNSPSRLLKLHAPRYLTWDEIRGHDSNTKTQYAVKNVTFRSSDNERVGMWIVLPGGAKKPMPFVIDLHGGPHGVVGDEYSPEAHAWLENGFGYCAVNYRGSIGFGKKFERKIYGNPGHWEVEDTVAARNSLIKLGYADPDRIVLHGWSWGGYVTLLALGKYPDLWKCGIAGAAISDYLLQYADEPEYFKAEDRKRFNGTPKTARARYVKSSPSTYGDRIQAPILILHGENDMRCPPRQITHFENQLLEAGKPVSVEWFPSGHIGEFTDTRLRLSLMKKIIRFAIQNTKRSH